MRKLNRLRGSGPFDFFSKFTNPFKKSNCEAQQPPPPREEPQEPQYQDTSSVEGQVPGEGVYKGGRRTRTRRRKGRRSRRRSSVRQRR